MAATWDPRKTRALVVGVLLYADAAEADWDLATRRDSVFVDTLVARGVPKSNIVTLLDGAATLDGLRRSLTELLSGSAADDTFIFYFAGHGSRGEDAGDAGCLYLCQHDCHSKGYFSASELFTAIERYFKGSRALLFADCCYSGFLALDAPRRAGHIQYGILTSQMAAQTSTGSWTFTNALIAGFSQKLAVDLSGDGILTFSELATYLEALMAAEAGQLSMCNAVNGFPSDFIIGRAEPKGPKPPPACVTPTFAPGTRVRVRVERGKGAAFVPATVLAARRGIHLVHVDGKGEVDDVWVGPNEIINTETGAVGGAGAMAGGGGAAAGGAFSVGEHVEAKWWDEKAYPGYFPAVIKAATPAFEILYDDGNKAMVAAAHVKGGPLTPGMAVEARWAEGKDPKFPGWYPGHIKAVTTLYNLEYSDGSTATMVEAKTIRKA